MAIGTKRRRRGAVDGQGLFERSSTDDESSLLMRKSRRIVRKRLLLILVCAVMASLLAISVTTTRVLQHAAEADTESSFGDGLVPSWKRLLLKNLGPASWTMRPNRQRRGMSQDDIDSALRRFRSSQSGGQEESTKKPKKQALRIQRQITNPEIHSKTGKRTFGCLRDECRGLAMEDLTNRRWKMMYKNAKVIGPGNSSVFKENLNVKLTWLESDTTELTKLKKDRPQTFEQAYTKQIGKTYLSVLDGADAIGGNKGQQLRGKQSFVRKRSFLDEIFPEMRETESEGEGGTDSKKRKKKRRHECSYNDLALQPAQYRIYMKDDCEEFLRNEGNGKSFLIKPETGSQGKGITFHSGVTLVKKKVPKFFPCKEDNPSMSALERVLVQEYIKQPLLLEKTKFDVRVYMLIASSDPWMVFYHQGYLRRSLFEYSPSSRNRAVYLTNTHYQSMKQGFKLSDHIWTFDKLQAYLTTNARAGAHYVDSVLEPYIKRVANFIFQSARRKLERRKGSFHIFGLDFMVDEDFRTHFIEANGYPGYTWSINFDTRGFVAEQFNLVLELHEHPNVFEKMRAGDQYANFKLIFSELEEAEKGFLYDPCYEFFNNAESFKVLRGAMERFAKYTGFAASKALLSEEDEKCKSQKCKSRRKEARKQAARQRHAAERLFQGFVDDVAGVELGAGTKTDQVSTLARFARLNGCSLNKMMVMPATYRMYLDEECANALKYRTPSQWIAKPMDGARAGKFEFFEHQRELGSRFRGCVDGVPKGKLDLEDQNDAKNHRVEILKVRSDLQYVVQKHITNRLLVKDRTWDFRAYMLIACTQPFFVFYHDGFARTSSLKRNSPEDSPEAFLLGKTELTFSDFQMLLSQEAKTGDYFMSSAFATYAKQVMRLLFHAIRPNLQRKPKTYQLMELTFIVDNAFTFWYVGANSSPQLSRSPKVNKEVIQPMQDEIKSVVLETHDTPEALAGMRYGDSYGDLRLVFSEFEDHIRNETFNPCEAFASKWTLSKVALELTAKLHDYKTRVENANMRELKKYTRAAWDKCRSKGKVETCMQSDAVRRALRDRYEAYLDKSAVVMESDQQEAEDAKARREKEIEEYVQSRLEDVAGISHEENEQESESKD